MENQHHREAEVTKVQMPIQAQSNQLTIPIAIVIAGALIAGAVFFSSRSNSPVAGNLQPQTAGQQPTAQSADISKVKTDGQPFVGNPNAPITVAYWFDYQCPFCRKFEEESMPQLMKDYVLTGKGKVVFKDFQFLGSDSQTLGEYSRAVWETAPDKFYSWHKTMYDNQGTENTGWATEAKINSITTDVLGASDTARVVALVRSKGDDYQKEMDSDKAEGASFGVTGTPSFVIGKQLLVGAQPYSAIKQLIDLAGK